MVRPPERRIFLAGEGPVRVSAGAPGSRPQSEGEIQTDQSGVSRVHYGWRANRWAATRVNAIAASFLQPKGV